MVMAGFRKGRGTRHEIANIRWITGCWSFNGPEPGGLELTMKRVKEGKRLIFLGLHSRVSCSRESARNREIEKESKKERHGDQNSDGAKVF